MIIHFSTLHSPQSTRIYHKFIKATNESYNNQALYLCGGKSKLDLPEGVLSISKYFGSSIKARLLNLIKGSYLIIKKRPSSVQLHDPELLVVAPLFRLFAIRVIYDSHENFPAQFTSHNKKYLQFKNLITFVEDSFVKLFANYVIAATDEIYERFNSYHKNVFLIENGPRKKPKVINGFKDIDFFYAGLIAPNRGIFEILEALENTNIQIHICGPFSSESYMNQCLKTSFWKNNIFYHGVLTQKQVEEMMQRSQYGIVSLINTDNYKDSRPTKLYEYLANRTKVIASKNPYVESVVSKHKLGYIFDLNSKSNISEVFTKAANDNTQVSIESVNDFFSKINFFDDQLNCFLEHIK